MDAYVLEKIGLTPGESKVYLTLLKLGSSKTGPLAKEAQVSSSKVYKILDRLIVKGLVGFITKGKIKYFTAVEPKRVLEYLEEKEKELQEKKAYVKEILPQLELQQKMGKQIEAVIYNGFKACTNVFRNILDELNPGETYYVIGAGYGTTKGIRSFFRQHHAARAKKGILVKMLANFDTRGSIEVGTEKAETKYLPQYLVTNMEILFYKDKAFIVLWTSTPTGFLIVGEEAVKSFRSYFEAFWKIAEE